MRIVKRTLTTDYYDGDINDKHYRGLTDSECVYQAEKAVSCFFRDKRFSFNFWANGKDFWYADRKIIKYLFNHPEFRKRAQMRNACIVGIKIPPEYQVSVELYGLSLIEKFLKNGDDRHR